MIEVPRPSIGEGPSAIDDLHDINPRAYGSSPS